MPHRPGEYEPTNVGTLLQIHGIDLCVLYHTPVRGGGQAKPQNQPFERVGQVMHDITTSAHQLITEMQWYSHSGVVSARRAKRGEEDQLRTLGYDRIWKVGGTFFFLSFPSFPLCFYGQEGQTANPAFYYSSSDVSYLGPGAHEAGDDLRSDPD
jgi:hypothetical protein